MEIIRDTFSPQIQNATSHSELRDLLLMEKVAFVMECGFLKPATTVVTGDIPAIVRAVYLECILFRSSQEIAQFIDGLQTIGIATLIKRHPLTLKKLFIHDATTKVTAQYLSELLVPILSPRGHNQREDGGSSCAELPPGYRRYTHSNWKRL